MVGVPSGTLGWLRDQIRLCVTSSFSTKPHETSLPEPPTPLSAKDNFDLNSRRYGLNPGLSSDRQLQRQPILLVDDSYRSLP